MNRTSEQRLTKLIPEFAVKVRLLVDAVWKRGHIIEITQGLRTFEEQDGLFSQGRTRRGAVVTNARGGQSLHNYGAAVDFALMVNEKYVWPDPHPVWKIIAEEAQKLGLEAGYYWPKPDKPHVEIAGVGWRELLAAHKKGGMEAAQGLAKGFLK